MRIWPNVVSILTHRQQRWTNIGTTLGQVFVFAERAVSALKRAGHLCLVGTGCRVICVRVNMFKGESCIWTMHLSYTFISWYIISYAMEKIKHDIYTAHWWKKSTFWARHAQLTAKCMIPSGYDRSCTVNTCLCIHLQPLFSWAWNKILHKNIDTKLNYLFEGHKSIF